MSGSMSGHRLNPADPMSMSHLQVAVFRGGGDR
jgi:hypothetical protein